MPLLLDPDAIDLHTIRRLWLGQPIMRDPLLGEQAEAGVDAVHRLAPGHDARNGSGAGPDAIHGGAIQSRRLPKPQLAKNGEVDGFGIEEQGHGAGALPDCRPCSQHKRKGRLRVETPFPLLNDPA